jgi:hypothetical protein
MAQCVHASQRSMSGSATEWGGALAQPLAPFVTAVLDKVRCSLPALVANSLHHAVEHPREVPGVDLIGGQACEVFTASHTRHQSIRLDVTYNRGVAALDLTHWVW